MCTLIAGVNVLGPGTIAVAANRDEAPARPSRLPGVLSAEPRVVGGRDAVAGGTWLAIREARAIVALLNRRGVAPEPAWTNASGAGRMDPGGAGAEAPRSRGLLTLDVACVPSPSAPGLADAALVAARSSLGAHAYAPFSLAFLSPDRSWVLSLTDGTPRVQDLSPGWHVLTHSVLDDPEEPRTARLLRELRSHAPRDAATCVAGLLRLLALHAGEDPAEPAVCIHAGPMPTVSSAVVTLGPAGTRYLHVEGRPCEAPARDLGDLLAPPPGGR